MMDINLRVRCRLCGARIGMRCRTEGERVRWESHACRRRDAMMRPASRILGVGELFQRADLLAVRDGALTTYEAVSATRTISDATYRVGVAAICVESVHATKGEPVALAILRRWTNPAALYAASRRELTDMLRPLGCEVARWTALRFHVHSSCSWESVSDALRLFVYGDTGFSPRNEILQAARQRMLSQEVPG